MVIRDKRNEMVRFGSIKCGDVFTVHGEGIYMKTEATCCDDNGYYENTVNLADGNLRYWEDSKMVRLIKCELVID